MNPDGSDQHQITDWHGAESILYVAWSPDDTELIVTLLGDDRRLVTMPAGGGAFTDFIGPSSSFASTGVKGSMVYSSEDDPPGSTIYLSYFYDPLNSSPYAAGDTPNLTPDGMYAVVQIGDPGSRYIETYTLSPYDSAMWSIPRVADDSNPVWIVPDHAHIAFVSAGPDGETIQICRIGNDFATPIEIAPHDRVWYLSKRFAGSEAPAEPPAPPTEAPSGPGALPTLEPLPVQQESGLAGNGYAGPNGSYEVNWTSAWEVRPEFTGPQTDGSDRLTLWYTGGKVATVDFRTGSILGSDPETCVDETIATLQDGDRFEDNVMPYDAPALVPPPGSAGRTAWNFLQRDYLYTYVECRPLVDGSGLLRIVYQVPDDTYAIVYTDIVTLLAAVETG